MLIISIEGIDGSGKTSVANKLAETLPKHGVVAKKLSMLPEGKVREAILTDHTLSNLQRNTLLKVAAETTRQEIARLSVEDKTDIVILDRGEDTYIAYAHDDNSSVKVVRSLRTIYPMFPIPYRTYMLRVIPEQSLARAAKRSQADIIEAKPLSYHEKVQEIMLANISFDQLANAVTQRMVVIDAEQPFETVFNEILEDILSYTKLIILE